ncbi:MAG: hypothetical protein KC592_01700, partial [Nitrospira sp.]|nr:hypothetical protein [Nitrospira sp.]
ITPTDTCEISLSKIGDSLGGEFPPQKMRGVFWTFMVGYQKSPQQLITGGHARCGGKRYGTASRYNKSKNSIGEYCYSGLQRTKND